jgi:Cu/Ag efflux protein CusF
MNRIVKAGLLAAGIWMVAGPVVWAAETAPDMKPKPGVLNATAASVTATVQDIDYKTRMITLKGPQGDVETMEVGPEVVRFNEIKKGDLVQIDYLESVAVMVQSPDQAVSSAEGTSSALVRNKTKLPSGMMVQTDVITATVEKIDAKKRTATLKGPQGNTLHVDIAPDVMHVENVKKGDQVLVKVTRTVAMAIRKPTK